MRLRCGLHQRSVHAQVTTTALFDAVFVVNPLLGYACDSKPARTNDCVARGQESDSSCLVLLPFSPIADTKPSVGAQAAVNDWQESFDNWPFVDILPVEYDAIGQDTSTYAVWVVSADAVPESASWTLALAALDLAGNGPIARNSIALIAQRRCAPSAVGPASGARV